MATINTNDKTAFLFRENKSYCNCPRASDKELLCKCGETNQISVWGWDVNNRTPSALVSNGNQQVYFHRGYSTGNACVRGDTPMVGGNHYYWEIKMKSAVYGTSIMIGVGTEKFDFNQSNEQFCNLLGSDNESWGMKFNGRIFHGGKSYEYHPIAGFTIGSLIGVHLDMWNGTLEYYLNRIPLGVAFVGLKDKVLYPLMSSTAAHSIIKLVYSHVEPFSLKWLALKQVTDFSQFPPGLKSCIPNCWWMFPKSTRLKDELDGIQNDDEQQGSLFRMIDSDEEEEEIGNALGRNLLARRMRRVLENSNELHHFFRMRPRYAIATRTDSTPSDLCRIARPIRRCRLRSRNNCAEY